LLVKRSTGNISNHRKSIHLFITGKIWFTKHAWWRTHIRKEEDYWFREYGILEASNQNRRMDQEMEHPYKHR